MAGSAKSRTAPSRRWTITWALLLSVYVSIAVVPSAKAALDCSGPVDGGVLVINTDDVSLSLTAATPSEGPGVNIACDSGTPLENVVTLTVYGAGLDSTVTFNDAASALWGGLTLTIDLGDGSSDKVVLSGTSASDTINAQLFNSYTGVEFIEVNGLGGSDTLRGSNTIPTTLQGGAGADTLVGGSGTNDTVSYADSPSAVTINLATNTHSGGNADNGAGTDDDISGVENILGSPYDDTLTGDTSANTVRGGAGDDTIVGGPGNDDLDGGTGTADTVSYDEDEFTGASDGAVTVNLSSGAASGGGDDDTLAGFENVTGSSFADLLVGSALANQIQGLGGADTISGGEANDTIVGGYGADDMYGGPGAGDTVSYDEDTFKDASDEAVTVNLISGAALGGGDDDTLAGFENVTGSSFDDRLVGDANANTIQGLTGDDTIVGGLGVDDLYGGSSEDDTSTDDTASYDEVAFPGANNGTGINVNLSSGAVSGGGGADTLDGFENLTGSGFNDVLTGDALENTIRGLAGNDAIEGADDGDDLFGGSGSDTLSYAGSDALVSVDLETGEASGGHAGDDVFSGFENLTGSVYADSLAGDSISNVINGLAGEDWIWGSGGADRLYGGDGNDEIDGDTGSDVIYGEGDGDTSLKGGLGNDVIYGGDGLDTILGEAGSDRLYGDAQSDSIDGGSGSDTIYAKGDGFVDNVTGGADKDVCNIDQSLSVTDVVSPSGSCENIKTKK